MDRATLKLTTGQTVIHCDGTGRGAPTILLNSHLSGMVREDDKGVYHVGMLLLLNPPLGVISLHAPTGGTGGEPLTKFRD